MKINIGRTFLYLFSIPFCLIIKYTNSLIKLGWSLVSSVLLLLLLIIEIVVTIINIINCDIVIIIYVFIYFFGITSPLRGEKNALTSESYPLSKLPRTFGGLRCSISLSVWIAKSQSFLRLSFSSTGSG